MLEGFKKVAPSRGVPTVAIVKDGLVFNKNVAKYFGERNRVLFLINKDEKKIALQKIDGRDEQSITFYRRMNGARFSYRELVRQVFALGDFDLEHYYYKVKGTVIEEEKAIVFDITEALQKDRIFRNKGYYENADKSDE